MKLALAEEVTELKKDLLVLMVALCACGRPSDVGASLAKFAGYWRNTNAGAGDLAELVIHVSGDAVSIRAWAKCHPENCDWGEVEGEAYGQRGSDKPDDVISAVFDSGSTQTSIFIRHSYHSSRSYRGREEQLQIQLYTRFTDLSGKGNYKTYCKMIRASGAPPEDIQPTPDGYPYRLVFVQQNLTSDGYAEDVGNIARRASKHGYTGMVLSAGLDAIELKQPVYLERLKRVKDTCDEVGIELYPLIFSAGYAYGTLAHDRNLAAAMPVRRVALAINNGRGVLIKDPNTGINNGGFESFSGDRVTDFRWQDQAGEVSFCDADVVKEGRMSLRFENVSESQNGMGRVIQTVKVRPFLCYRLSCWVKTEDLNPPEHFRIAAMTEDGRVLMRCNPELQSTQDWEKVSLVFNSLEYDAVNLYAGVWNRPSGRFWIDDMKLTEVGFFNVLRRPGTPVSVRNAETGVTYTEGTDFEKIVDDGFSFEDDHVDAILKTLPGSAIRDGDRLVADYYQALALKQGSWQMGVCLSEPRVYEIWGKVVEILDRHIAPKGYLFSMDEIRQGGWCKACVDRGLSAGELLGDCITRQVELVRAVNPNAEIFVWSDMLDPNHHAKDRYYLFKGDFTGSWNHVPKDIIIACWNYEKRVESLRHFDELSFRTIGCGYYDSGSLENARGWLEALSNTAGACGIMYTTWRSKYDHLESFGDLVVTE